jgi:hypothetical protein
MRNDVSKLTTTREVVTALGGTKSVARLTGRKYSAAANWPLSGQFPANTYVAISAALAAIGKNAPPSLWGMTAAEKDSAA